MSTEFKSSDFDNVIIGEKKLGGGIFGDVFTGILQDGRFVAVRVFDTLPDDAVEENHEPVVEACKLRHPNIVRYLHSRTVPENKQQSSSYCSVQIFMELVNSGPLSEVVKSFPNRRLPLIAVQRYARQILEGLCYIHAKSTPHRSLRTDKILISVDTGVIKLSGFDESRCLHKLAGKQRLNRACDTEKKIMNTAPEIINNGDKGYDPFKSDVWAAGCTIAELVTGKPVWEKTENPIGLLMKISTCSGWPDAIPKDDPKIPMTPELIDFLDKIFVKDPEKRAAVIDCLDHPFLKKN